MILDFKSGYQKNVYYFNMTISFDQDCSRFSSGDCQHNDEDYDLYIKLLGCGVSGVFFHSLIEILSLQFNDDFILTIKNFIRGIVAQKVKLVRVWYVLGIQR